MGRNAQKRRSKRIKASLKPGPGPGRDVDTDALEDDELLEEEAPRRAPLWLKQTVAADADSIAVTDDSLSASLVRMALRIASGRPGAELARDLAEVFGADAAVLVRIPWGPDRPRRVAGRYRRSQWERAVLLERLVSDAVVEQARTSGTPVFVADVPRDGRVPANLGTKTRFGSLAVVWLGAENAGWGYLCLARREVGGFHHADEEMLHAVAVSLGPDLVQAEALHRGLTDPLTGLLSRQAIFLQLRREIERAGRADVPFSLVVVDVDGLRNVNDAHGREIGDEVLKRCGARLAGAFRSAELCGRLTGDKFLVAVDADRDATERAAERLLEAMAGEPLEVEGRTLDVTLSAGIAQKRPDEDSLALLVRAEAGLALAKREGGARLGLGPEPNGNPLNIGDEGGFPDDPLD